MPAPAWRGGRWYRGFATGVPTGAFFGVLAWLDSGFFLAFTVVLPVLGIGYGVWMARRMGRYWPGASAFSGPDRVVLVRAARRGERVAESRLVPGVVEYAQGLAAVRADAHVRWRWIIWLVLVVAVACALYDAVSGSWGNVIVSVIYLAMLLFELFRWPAVRDHIVANAERSATLSAEAV